MPAATGQRRRVIAFTLIEMILSIGIMALVMIAINSVLFSALKLRESTYRSLEESLPVEQSLAILRRDLQGAVPPSEEALLAGSFRVGGVASLGSSLPVAIELSTTTGVMHSDEPWSEVQRVTYGLRPSANRLAPGQDLIRGVTRNVLATIAEQPAEQWMMSGVENIDFECYDGTQWRNVWDTEQTDTNLPSAIRVRIMLAKTQDNSARSQSIEMVVPIDSQSRTNMGTNSTSTY